MQPISDKSVSASFTGYRTYEIIQSLRRPNLSAEIYSEVYNTIKKLNKQGYTNFLSGMSEGFDMISSEAVLALRSEGYGIRLIAVVPFEGQELRYTDTDKARYKAIFDSADEVIFTSYRYYSGCYHKRNDYLIENCSMVVCYYSGLGGGTKYTLERAQRADLPIVNILHGILNDEPSTSEPAPPKASLFSRLIAFLVKLRQ